MSKKGASFHRPPGAGTIDDETVALFCRARAIQHTALDQIWEPIGRRREYLDLVAELDDRLGRRPWQEGVMNVTPDMEVDAPEDEVRDERGAIRLRRALESLL
jgi:hypothetical protein